MNDRIRVVRRRVKGLLGMGVHLYADAAVRAGEFYPELMQPGVLDLKTADVSAVLAVDHLRDGFRCRPGAYPKRLALALARPAFAEVGERPCQERRRQAQSHALLETAADLARTKQ